MQILTSVGFQSTGAATANKWAHIGLCVCAYWNKIVGRSDVSSLKSPRRNARGQHIATSVESTVYFEKNN